MTFPSARKFAVLLCWVSLALLAGCLPNVYHRPYPAGEVVLPRDDAAHPAPIEWWYYTGHLEDEEGRRYGFELTIFKAYAPPQVKLMGFLPAYWLAEKGHVAHFALTDLATGRFVSGERADFWGYEAGTSADRLEAYVGDWRIERAPDGKSHRLVAAGGGFEMDLVLEPLKPAALHGDPPGIQSMGPGGVSYYVSYTRMGVTGTLGRDCNFFGCKTLTVTGQAWSDHQWGDFGFADYAGWDWFSLQFDDDTELMLYLIRGPDGSYDFRAGSFITYDGKTLELSAEDYTVTATGETWASPRTGAVYPVGWRVVVPDRRIDVTVTPLMLEQEMDTRASTGVVYWEGAVRAQGSHEGLGFVELTNYDRYPFAGMR